MLYARARNEGELTQGRSPQNLIHQQSDNYLDRLCVSSREVYQPRFNNCCPEMRGFGGCLVITNQTGALLIYREYIEISPYMGTTWAC